MIDPVRFTNYQLSDLGLQEYILFCIAAAGKNATTTARILDNFLRHIMLQTSASDYFKAIKIIALTQDLAILMKKFGFGCYQLKSKSFLSIADSNLNLRTCTIAELEKIPGIGMKTSRFFVMHTRLECNVACLDVHILRWMKKRGYKNVPSQTPTKKRYLEIEKKFLEVCKKLKTNPAVLDLQIWNDERKSFAEEVKPILVWN